MDLSSKVCLPAVINAPPRGGMQLNEHGEPVYGPRDAPNLETIRNLGLPFWLAGSYSTPDKFREAVAAGAGPVCRSGRLLRFARSPGCGTT